MLGQIPWWLSVSSFDGAHSFIVFFQIPVIAPAGNRKKVEQGVKPILTVTLSEKIDNF
jgi:hypothetical protein